MNPVLRLTATLSLSCAVYSCSASKPSPSTTSAGGRGGVGAGGSGGQQSTAGGAPPLLIAPEPSLDCNDTSGSLGCSFYSVRPPRMARLSVGDNAPANGACFAAFVVNASASPVSIQVEFQGALLDTQKLARIPKGSGASISYQPLPSGMLPPNEVAILFLMHSSRSSLRCPSDAGYERVPAFDDPTGTVVDKAFHITTSAPVAAYDIFPYGGGKSAVSSATLLLPTTVWDTNYVAVSPYSGATQFPSTIQLVAQEDGTEVTVAPRADILAGPNVPASKANQPQTYQLGRGDVLQLAPPGAEELGGSAVLANKPIGLWAALSCASVPGSAMACDSLHQQIPPVRALGHRYVAVRHRNRFESINEQAPFRVMGAVDGTTLTYSAGAPTTAPRSLSAGQTMEFLADAPFSVESQDPSHPFYLATYMTGCGDVSKDPGSDCRGDPEFVNVVPTEQYASSYVFFTDPTYPETSLALVRARTGGVFEDVVVDCVGTVTGWQPLGDNADYEVARLDLVHGNFEPQGKCDNGRHEASSHAPFAVTVWGWGSGLTGGSTVTDPQYTQCVSYAYPAGAGVQRINSTVVQPVVK